NLALAIPPIRITLTHELMLILSGHLGRFQEYLRSLGFWGPLVSTTLMVVQAIVFPVPVTLLMIANGLVFGVWAGMLVSFVGGLVGAIAAYVIGHQVGREAVSRLLSKSSLDAADRAMVRRGGWAVVIGRWIPGVPSDPI